MTDTGRRIIKDLQASADEEYRVFQSSLIPGRDPSAFIGVRTPELRKLAKAYSAERSPVEKNFRKDYVWRWKNR